MPEGPEIRLAADRIAKVLVDRPLKRVEITIPKLRDYESELVGCSIAAIDTRGKAMLTRFDNGLVMYSHNQLYGRWYTSKLPKLPGTTRSLRVAFDTDSHTARLYSATDIDILHESELDLHPFLRRVGPDVLDERLDAETVAERLDDRRFRGRSLAALYLDQQFLAGIGNYLRSEILFVAGLAPELRPKDLDARQRKKLARDTLKICRRAYRTRGVTVTDSMAAKLKRQGLSYGQYRHFVFTREGKPCYLCRSTIRRDILAGRQIYSCPGCQPGE